MNQAHRIVSSEAEELVLVDGEDNKTGYMSKASCHDGDGILHRAFSLFLFDSAGRLLLQRRATSKRLWPGYWSNSCCSHPRRGESMAVATRRRLRDELNIDSRLQFVYKFRYQANFGAVGAENELCHVFVGAAPDEVHANKQEIEAVRFVSPAELQRDLESRPDEFTPWFKMEWQSLNTAHKDVLERFTTTGQ